MDGAIFIADIEPDTVAVVFDKRAILEHDATAQAYLVAARLPAAVESFDIIVSYRASGHSQPVGTIGSETELAVVLERASADGDIFTCECGATCIGALEDTVLDGQMIAGKFDGSVLRAIGCISKAHTFDYNIIALDGKNRIAY